jgi:hypothetical protein
MVVLEALYWSNVAIFCMITIPPLYSIELSLVSVQKANFAASHGK